MGCRVDEPRLIWVCAYMIYVSYMQKGKAGMTFLEVDAFLWYIKKHFAGLTVMYKKKKKKALHFVMHTVLKQ